MIKGVRVMKIGTYLIRDLGTAFLTVIVTGFFVAFMGGCGTGGTVSTSGVTDEQREAILEAIDAEDFFTDSLTDTNEDEEAAADAAAQIYTAAFPSASLSAVSLTVELPEYWWRGQQELLDRTVDIHIEGGVAEVTVVCDVTGTFFTADKIDDVLVLWGKPYESLITRNAVFEEMSWGWVLTALSPVEFASAAPGDITVSIEALRAYSGSELIWEASDTGAMYSVPEAIPSFLPGDEIRIEAQVSNISTAGWVPGEFVFLHRPGHNITGRRTRDIMFDDGTNGDTTAGDGIYTRSYTIGPCPGRHFAAVDVIDAGTFAELESPVNSIAWGMPYIVE